MASTSPSSWILRHRFVFLGLHGFPAFELRLVELPTTQAYYRNPIRSLGRSADLWGLCCGFTDLSMSCMYVTRVCIEEHRCATQYGDIGFVSHELCSVPSSEPISGLISRQLGAIKMPETVTRHDFRNVGLDHHVEFPRVLSSARHKICMLCRSPTPRRSASI